ncbi:MAG: autotransporter-associated beta strand repeat-containing protein, partial [Alphaproteobacteria bacterium]|nr:autotransporter-associated beta strand repeat-containing protein [Alphaproteobacteria bacterium]
GLTIANGGTVQFLGANTYSGVTNIHGGTLEAQDGSNIDVYSEIQFSGAGSIGATNGTALSMASAGVLLSGGTFTRFVGAGPTDVTWTGSGGFAATSGGLTVNLGALNGGAGPTLNWGSGSFTPVGSVLVFGSDATDATGTVTFENAINLQQQAGNIAVYDNTASANAYAVMTGAISNGVLNVNDVGFAGTLYLTAQNSLSGLTLNAGTLSTTYGGRVGTLMNTGSGGYLTINGGTVDLGGAEKLTTVSVASGATLNAAGLVSAGAITTAGTVSFMDGLNAASIDNSGLLTLNGATIVSGAVTNEAAGQLDQFGNMSAASAVNNGAWYLTGNLTASGAVTNNGTLVVVGVIPSGSSVDATAATRTLTTSGFAGGANGVVQLGGINGTVANTLVINQSGASTYNGVFEGAGGLTKQGAGALSLGGASSFTGPVLISGGTLALVGAGSIADASNVTDNATFDISGTTAGASVVTLSGNGQVNLGSQTLTLSNASTTFSGVIGGAGSVGVAAGTETLTGVNTYTGTTAIV